TLKVWGTAIPAQITEIIFPSGGRFRELSRLPMTTTFDALRFVSLGSGAAWWAVGIVPAIRTHLASRSERALAATAFLVGGWAFLDAVYPALAGVAQSPDVVFLGLQLTLITFATLALLLTTNWIARGPSRYDPLVVLIAILPLSADGWKEAFRGGSVIQKRVNAIYMFYRTGEPLVALASSRNLPIGAEQLEGLLAVVGNFVETSVPVSRGYAVTAMRYEGLGIVAVRGEFVIVAAVYDGPAYDALRGELTGALKVFEERSWRQLGTWETATSVAEAAAGELSNFLEHPKRTTPPRLPKVSPPEMKSRKAS